MKKLTSILIMLFVMLFTINVKAGNIFEMSPTIQKGNETGYLYNSMPTEVDKENPISVKLVVNNFLGWKIEHANIVISWDDNAFELVETNGKYYKNLDAGVDGFSLEIAGKNRVHIVYSYDRVAASQDSVAIAELNFRLKDGVKTGVYEIRQDVVENSLTIEPTDGVYDTIMAHEKILYYQVGKPTINSNLTRADIENIVGDVYIIGNHMFTRGKGGEGYNGTLTTEYIMLASKSIESNSKNDMIITTKTLFGDWENAINNNPITPENEYKITYIDMIPNYAHNGIYVGDNEQTIIRVIQINDKEALVTIESELERIHGIGNVNGNKVILSANGKSYEITVNDNTLTLSTSDTYIGNKQLNKRTNLTLNDYFNNAYANGIYDGYGSAVHYIKSSHSGKYVRGNNELDILRVSENSVRVCVKGTNDSECAIDTYFMNNEGDNHRLGTDETTYAVELGNAIYGINISENQANLLCLSDGCSYTGIYSKENNPMSIEDALHIWEKNVISYRVSFDPGAPEDSFYVFIPQGTVIKGDPIWDSYSNDYEKDGFVFVEWRLNGNAFDFTTPITAPIDLVGHYVKRPGAPVLSVSPYNLEHDYTNYANDVFEYDLTIECEDDYDGFKIFSTTDLENAVANATYGNTASVSVATNGNMTYIAVPYVLVHGEEEKGETSNELNLNPVKYTVTFDSNGGSSVASQEVPYGGKAVEPLDENDKPLSSRTGYDFDKWQLNGVDFDFENTPINGDITLVATWINNITTPVVVDEISNSDYYAHSIRLSDETLAINCRNANGECTGVSTDNYYISGYSLYTVDGIGDKHLATIGGKTQFAPYEVVLLTAEPNTTVRYVARAYIKEGALYTYSDYSDEFVIDTTFVTPTIAFNPNGGVHNPSNVVENWIEITNVMSGYGHMCGVTTCDDYKVDGYVLYKKVQDEYVSVQTYGLNDKALVTANYGEDARYYVKVFAYDSEGDPQYGAPSNELVLDTTIPAPVMSGNKVNSSRALLLYHAGVPETLTYEIELSVEDNIVGVDGYEFFIKEGNIYTGIDNFNDTAAIAQVAEGSSKTFVARAYIIGENNIRSYGAISNEITIDLTNPTYTFETVESQSNSAKVNVRGYLNDYELALQGIKVGGVIYADGSQDTGEWVDIDATLMENVDTIILGLEQVSAVNPDIFALEKEATRKN